MQNKLITIKIKSQKELNKKWDSVSHFINSTEDRSIFKKAKKLQQSFNIRFVKTTRNNETLCYFGRRIGVRNMLRADSGTSIIVTMVYPEQLYTFLYENYYKPHIDQGIWNITFLNQETVDDDLINEKKHYNSLTGGKK